MNPDFTYKVFHNYDNDREWYQWKVYCGPIVLDHGTAGTRGFSRMMAKRYIGTYALARLKAITELIESSDNDLVQLVND